METPGEFWLPKHQGMTKALKDNHISRPKKRRKTFCSQSNLDTTGSGVKPTAGTAKKKKRKGGTGNGKLSGGTRRRAAIGGKGHHEFSDERS